MKSIARTRPVISLVCSLAKMDEHHNSLAMNWERIDLTLHLRGKVVPETDGSTDESAARANSTFCA